MKELTFLKNYRERIQLITNELFEALVYLNKQENKDYDTLKVVGGYYDSNLHTIKMLTDKIERLEDK